MDKLRVCVWTMYFWVSVPLIKGRKVLYLTNKLLDSYMCPPSDMTFTLTGLGQVDCTAACNNANTCESVFYHAASNRCFGCTGYYNEISIPSMYLLTGTRYYQRSLGAPGCNTLLSYYRLCDGGGTGIPSDSRGRVELWYHGVWYTVCNDQWAVKDEGYSPHNAGVICRQFGYNNGGSAIADVTYTSNVIPIIMDFVRCNGSETSLFQCPQNPLFHHNCRLEEAVGADCYTDD